MTTNNAVNSPLKGTTGNGHFVGSNEPTIFGPLIAQINDSNNNPELVFNSQANAINYVTIGNAATGNAPRIYAGGSDTNIGLSISAQGDETIVFNTGAVVQDALVINSGTGGQHTTGFTFANTFATRTINFPDASGTVALTGTLVNVQVFTSGTAATYTLTSGANSILVELIGGGGGGAGAVGTVSALSCGGGGGAGGYARLFIASPASTYTYTVGTGGTAGANTGGSGGTGGTTTFAASSLQATGGTGGIASAPTVVTASGFANAGAGGIGTNGNINATGSPGGFGLTVLNNLASGNGGSSVYGGGGPSITNTTGAGNDGSSYGAGGSGASSTSAIGFTGGAGAPGLIFIWEFE